MQVDGGDPERAGGGARIEGATDHQGARNVSQGFVDRAGKVERARCRLHAAVATLEQAIVQEIAQPVQRLAHRRLAQAVMLCGARDVALGH